jgi:hypothetical protein
VTRRDDIPVTVPRTLADLRGAVSPHHYRRAVRQAEIAGFAIGEGIEGDHTRSDLERDFLRLCRSHDLPPPEVNVQIGRWTIDFVWCEARLAVETDSFRYHRGSVAFEDDHQRDLDLRARLRDPPLHWSPAPRGTRSRCRRPRHGPDGSCSQSRLRRLIELRRWPLTTSSF